MRTGCAEAVPGRLDAVKVVDCGGGVQGYLTGRWMDVDGDGHPGLVAYYEIAVPDYPILGQPRRSITGFVFYEAQYHCGHVWHVNGEPVPRRCPDCGLDVFLDELNDILALPCTTDGIVDGSAQ